MKKRRIIATLLTISMVLGLSACSDSGDKKDASIPDLDTQKSFESMVEKTGLSQDELVEENSSTDEDGSYFEGTFDVKYDKIDEYYFSANTEGEPVQVLFIKLKNSEDEDDVKDKLKDYIDSKVAEYQTYAPEYVDIMENSLVASKQGYVMLSTGEKTSHVKAVFDNLFE